VLGPNNMTTNSIPLLQVEGLTKSFGNVQAVSDMSLDVLPGQIHAVIGANGAGKSTLLNLVTGMVPPSSGDIVFKGSSIRGIAPHKLGKLGIGRSFQITSIINRFTVFQNVQLALLAHNERCRNAFRPAESQMRSETLASLDLLDLGDIANTLAGSLAAGDRKRLELAMAMSIEPTLLLLDEPTAGMSPQERHTITNLLQRINRDRALAVLFVEHDIDMVFSIAHWVTVMHHGAKLSEGLPAMVRSDPRVREVYTGEVTHAGV
jgi:branched-chain amino acid transport system ATP-binding protein